MMADVASTSMFFMVKIAREVRVSSKENDVKIVPEIDAILGPIEELFPRDSRTAADEVLPRPDEAGRTV